MALLDEVRQVLNRLATQGWRALFEQHDLDIQAADLAAELKRPLTAIRRDLPGFTEFTLSGIRAVEPGKPARSLLYHALASADVHPTANGQPAATAYPTLAELDVIENYIFSRDQRRLDSFTNPVIAVFAYQYRPASRSPHKRHADLAFSRTGVARVGTEAARYEAAARAFDPTPQNGERGFAVLPARYAAFIAERRSPSTSDSVMRTVGLDAQLTFLFPVHKLFPGTECLLDVNGEPLNLSGLDFVEYHINEKLRRLHTAAADNPGNIPPLAIFNLDQAPFLRDSKNSPDLITLERHGASVLVTPVHHPTVVRTATQRVDNRDELARFVVPPKNDDNRFWSSLQIPAKDRRRSAPEYANIRHQVIMKDGQQQTSDLNVTLNNAAFAEKLPTGGYEAAHFIDDTCDGALGVKINGFSLPVFCAYSLVTALDFFPKVDQVDIQKWVDEITGQPTSLGDPRVHFSQGGPRPLCDGRFNPSGLRPVKSSRIPNPKLPNPTQTTAAEQKAFLRTEAANLTATAIVGQAAAGGRAFKRLDRPRFTISWLTDTASDVFAPGWDVSQHGDQSGPFYTSYGLGSPFPEDSKLCAALNSFWPAAAPDTSRSFGLEPNGALMPTGIPMLDSELGYHRDHPRVRVGEVVSASGWDGEFGPFFEKDGATQFVNFVELLRCDYVSNALNGRFGFAGLDRVSSEDVIERMEALRFCIRTLPPVGDSPPFPMLWLITAESVPDWATWNSKITPRANATLTGAGHLYVFVTTTGAPVEIGDPARRKRIRVKDRFECQLDRQRLLWRRNDGPFTSVNRPAV